MSVITAVNKLMKKRRWKYRYEVIKLTTKEKSALATFGGSLFAMILVSAIIVLIN